MKYQFTCTESQLRLIAQCVEDCCRFSAGQCDLWHTISRLENHRDLKEDLEHLQHLVTPHLSRGSSYSWDGGHCPNDAQRQFIAQTYPIYREIWHFFAIQNGIENTYTSPTLTCAEGGAPIKIEYIDEKESLLCRIKSYLCRLATQINKQLFESSRVWYWVGDRVGDLCHFDETDFLTVDDMLLILEKDITFEQYSEWHCAELDHPEQHINLRSWVMGMRHAPSPDLSPNGEE